MTSTSTSVALGSYVVGEVPPPLTYQFLDADGTIINLTGFTIARFHWSDYVDGGVAVDPVAELAAITNPSEGLVTYTWDGDEFATTGEHVGQFFVNDGTIQYASILITWQVCTAIGVAPAV